MANIPCMIAPNVAANAALRKSINKTFYGTEKVLDDGTTQVRSFHFTKEDIGKYLVLRWRYEEHGWSIDRLSINDHVLNNYDDEIYGVYKIGYHDWCATTENISYKIHLEPIGKFIMWCPNRSWYTHDMEDHINMTYNLFGEYPIFDNIDEATEFAMKKNFELYPDNHSWFKKMFDKICNFLKIK